MNEFVRRTFLKGVGLAATGCLTGVGGIRQGWAQATKSRVVSVTDGAAWSGSGWSDQDLDASVVLVMVRRALLELTQQPDTTRAIEHLIPSVQDPSQRYGIKVNCVNPDLPSHPKLVLALVALLVEAGANPDNIIVYDRSDGELLGCGYRLNLGNGLKVYGTSRSGVGYDETPVGLTHGTVRLSKIVTERIDHLINVPVLKNHEMAEVTLALKNHFGSIDRPEYLHGPRRDCSPGIAELCAHPHIRDKTRLVLVDALFGTYVSGLASKPDFAPMKVIAGSDPVATDSVAQKLINTRRRQADRSSLDAKHIRDAETRGLGNHASSAIDHVDVSIHPVQEKPKPWAQNGSSGCSSLNSSGGYGLMLSGTLALARLRDQASSLPKNPKADSQTRGPGW